MQLEQPQETNEAATHERFRQDIKSLVKHIAEEGRRSRPPRSLRFEEAPIGSHQFFNHRLIDEKTGRILSETIHYDPSLFWNGPAGAFYAVLWHEFGHGEARYLPIENDDREIWFAAEVKRRPDELHRLLNLKYDVLLDANNIYDRPGLLSPYRCLYDYYFPRTVEEQTPQLEELVTKADGGEAATELVRRLQAHYMRPFNFLTALKHQGYWSHEDERDEIPDDERMENPYVTQDVELSEIFTKVRSDIELVADPRRGTALRGELFNRKIAPVYFEMLETSTSAMQSEITQAVKDGKLSPQDAANLERAIRQEAAKREAQDMERLAERLEKILERLLQELEQAEQAGAEKEKTQLQQQAAKAKAYAETARQKAEQIKQAQEAKNRLQNAEQTAGMTVEELVEAIMAALKDLANQQKTSDVQSAKVKDEKIGDQDARHPSQADDQQSEEQGNEPSAATQNGQTNAAQGGKAQGASSDQPAQAIPQNAQQPNDSTSRSSGADPNALQKKLEFLQKWNISERNDREYQRVRKLLDEAALDELVNGLVRCFSEDRLRVTLGDRPAGRLPTNRKAEAVRRRYAGEALPEVRDILKTVERFMGVDLIVVNDHSGSMKGRPELAAKAANLALAEAGLRVNTEVARRMRRSGYTSSEIRANTPVRYLGLLFSNLVAAMNQDGWQHTEDLRGDDADDRDYAKEKRLLELFPAYDNMPMNSTNDLLATAHALYEAYGREFPLLQQPEKRVKLICFLTDGGDDPSNMSQTIRFLHGQGDQLPERMKQMLNYVEAGCAERIEQNILKYRDQLFVLAPGITDNGQTQFATIYNEGKMPAADDLRSHEENNIAFINSAQLNDLPKILLRIMKAKFGSPRFRAIRARCSPIVRARGIKQKN